MADRWSFALEQGVPTHMVVPRHQAADRLVHCAITIFAAIAGYRTFMAPHRVEKGRPYLLRDSRFALSAKEAHASLDKIEVRLQIHQTGEIRGGYGATRTSILRPLGRRRPRVSSRRRDARCPMEELHDTLMLYPPPHRALPAVPLPNSLLARLRM